jgi:hypothetical protein
VAMCSVKASLACSICQRHCLRRGASSPATSLWALHSPSHALARLAGYAVFADADGQGGAAKLGVVPASCAGLQKLAGVDGGEDAVNRAVAACIPVGHVGAKWDIAIAAVFLASPAARFISGLPRPPADQASYTFLSFRTSLLQGLGSVKHTRSHSATMVSIAAFPTNVMGAAQALGSHRRKVGHE